MWQVKLILTDYAHLTIWASARNESHAGMENQLTAMPLHKPRRLGTEGINHLTKCTISSQKQSNIESKL